jgi:hypothetical protein
MSFKLKQNELENLLWQEPLVISKNLVLTNEIGSRFRFPFVLKSGHQKPFSYSHYCNSDRFIVIAPWLPKHFHGDPKIFKSTHPALVIQSSTMETIGFVPYQSGVCHKAYDSVNLGTFIILADIDWFGLYATNIEANLIS